MPAARVPYWFSGIFFGVGVAGLAWGLNLWSIQEYRMLTYKPTNARVTEIHIKTDESEDGPVDHVIMTYTYSVGSTQYRSTRILPDSFVSSEDIDSSVIGNVRDFCSIHPVGSVFTAFYSPGDPHNAFAIKKAGWFPPSLALFFTPFFAVGFTAICQKYRGSQPMARPIPIQRERFCLLPERSVRESLRRNVGLTIVWIGYCALVIGGYFAVNGNVLDTFCKLAGGLAGLIAIALLNLTLRNWRLARTYLDPLVSVKNPIFAAGTIIDARVQQKFTREVNIEKIDEGLVCMAHDSIKSGGEISFVTNEHWNQWRTILTHQQQAVGSEISFDTQLEAPAKAEPSTRRGNRGFPYFEWFIVVRTHARGKPKFDSRFPVFLQGKPACAAT